MTENSFEIGDVVRIKESEWLNHQEILSRFGFKEDATYEVSGVYHSGVISLVGAPTTYYPHYFELSKSSGFNQIETGIKSDIARPILEERKIGKVRMELFDTGFPNAVLEIARMMTWANKHKGYKDNDWKVLPDAENAFKGAAARHRVKLDAQRSFGEDLLNCVDEESNITHLAHECFNNLALLELALTGKIK